MAFSKSNVNAQISLLKDYTHKDPAPIGTFQGIDFKEGGFSSLYPIAGTNGKEYWTISDRGVNIDAANANVSGCKPTYDKIYAFPTYAPKIHRIRVEGTSIKVLQTITMKRPNGTGATGLINPTGFGSTSAELASTDTVQNCANFNTKTAAKDVWGIDSEGLVVDKEGNFWIAEEGGPTIWKLNKNGVVVKEETEKREIEEVEEVIDDQSDSTEIVYSSDEEDKLRNNPLAKRTTAFLVFASENKKDKTDPSILNLGPSSINELIWLTEMGELWKALSEEEHANYAKKAQFINNQYDEFLDVKLD